MFAFSFLPRLYIKYLIVHLCVYRLRNIVFKLRRWYKCKSTFFYTIPVERDLCPHITCLTKILLTENLTWLLLGNGMTVTSKYFPYDIYVFSSFLVRIFNHCRIYLFYESQLLFLDTGFKMKYEQN